MQNERGSGFASLLKIVKDNCGVEAMSSAQSSAVFPRLPYTSKAVAVHREQNPREIQLLPRTFDDQGHATAEQRLTCFLNTSV